MASNSMTPGAFPSEQPVDRSAMGLAIQRDQIGLNARGSTLGQGRRMAPAASQLFSSPPISGGQFGSGHARSQVTFSGVQEPEAD
jgi:hypothetical protein